MTRRELREHCFKMLFCADFYQAEEKEEQLKQYFQAPEEDETSPDGVIRQRRRKSSLNSISRLRRRTRQAQRELTRSCTG